MNSTEMVAPEGLLMIVMVLIYVFVLVISVGLTLLIWCKLFSKAGYHWALGLLLLVPIANIVMPFMLAFGDWPIQKELRFLRQQQNPPTD